VLSLAGVAAWQRWRARAAHAGPTDCSWLGTGPLDYDDAAQPPTLDASVLASWAAAAAKSRLPDDRSVVADPTRSMSPQGKRCSSSKKLTR
jgi:hypothetical protein